MASVRQQRVRELLKREIGEAIRREFSVSEAGIITVNDVVMGGDVKSATVFISRPLSEERHHVAPGRRTSRAISCMPPGRAASQ